ncbi:carboxypeptidase regulatory-like domain-containing protein [Actinoplanes sp. NEAU-A11]|uniref:Carboxypeptidase regulatory-like domain-containing protein n=2 Tax=Actinoplanes aureus TaxID=2792083 RepID=A0A931CI44_9ACTN|nr:carboxypeptidase regulatory-like domain-containing protein [Actinoplanes aureus]
MKTWSGTCEFAVDATNPSAPSGISSTDYSSSEPSGGVGYPGNFKILPPDFSGLSADEAAKRKKDLYKYAWTFDSGVKLNAPTVPVNTTDYSGTISGWKPTTDGLKTLRVWSVDPAGRTSAEVTYTFTVLHGSGPAAAWDFDDTENPATAADTTQHGNTLNLSGATRTAGRGNDGSALSLNGTSGSAATSSVLTYPHASTGAAIAVRTDANFTVTARVKLASTATGTGQNTAVAAGGNRVFAYSLGNAQSDGKWRFTMTGADADNATTYSAVSNGAAVAGKWTHLAGVYDSATKKLTLYVNGVAQTATATAATVFNATGPVTIGKRKWNGVDSGYFNGVVDDVQVFSSAMKPDTFVDLAKPLQPAITFPDGVEVAQNGTLKVTFDAAGDTNVTKFRYSVDGNTLDNTVNAGTAGGAATVNVPVGTSRGERQLFFASQDAIGTGPTNQRSFQVLAAASLFGPVVDDDGRPVAGAVVTLTPGGYTATSDADGIYNFPELPVNTYDIRASFGGRCGMAGLQTFLVGKHGIEIQVKIRRVGTEAGHLCTERTTAFATGTTVLPLTGDDAATKLTLPFAFPFYGSPAREVCVDTNGLITFTDPCVSYPHTGSAKLGAVAAPNGVIAPFWDNLVVDSAASVRTAVTGSGATQQVLIEWNNVHRKDNAAQRLSLSVTLGMDGTITTNYTGLDNAAEQGDNAAVGIESPTGEASLEYSTGDPVLSNGKAIVFSRASGDPLEVHNLTGKLTNNAGTAVAGATVTLDPSGLSTTTATDGSYAFFGLVADSYTVTSRQAGRCGVRAESVVDLSADTVRDLKFGPDYGEMGYACTVGASGYVAADTPTWLTGDDVETDVYLPFSMPFYGRSANYATVSTNGWVGIGGGYLTPLWSDLRIDEPASILTTSRGTAPNRSYVIEWRNALFNGTGERTTFEVILHEDGRVAYHYGAMSSDLQKGSTATVGMVAMSFRASAYYSEREPALTANSSITYTPAVTGAISGVLTEAVTTTPLAGTTITLNPGGQTVTTGADGSYQFTNVTPGAYYVLASPEGERCMGQYAAAEVFKTSGDAKSDLSLNNDADPFYHCTNAAQAFVAGDTVQSWTGDDEMWQATAPFPIKLYGESTTKPWISSNGFLTLSPEGATSPDRTPIPYEAEDGTPNAAIYPFWGDWVVDSSAAIATKVSGTAPNRQWLVEWRNVAWYGNDGVRVSFEAIFDEDGGITFAYDGIDDNPIERGAEATVGIENPGGTVAFQYLYSADLLTDGSGVHYTPRGFETGYINGRVTCAGEPVDSATVAVTGQSTTTSHDGEYFLGDIPAKTQTALVTVAAGDCAGTTTRPILAGESLQPTDFNLQATAQGSGYTITETETTYTPLDADTHLTRGYNTWTTVDLPFPVQVYGQTHTSMSVGTEGSLDFANAVLHPFRGDWEADDQSSIRAAVRGTAPNRQYVVEWRDVRHHTDPDTRLTFQVILHEAGGFSYVYPDTDTTFTRSGGAATIGLRSKDGGALLYADRLTALRPDVALRFEPVTA